MRSTDRSGIAVFLAVFLATFTLSGLTTDATYLGASWLLLLLLGGGTIVLRRARIGNAAVLGVQLALLAVYSLLLSATMPAPTSASLDAPWFVHYPALWADGIHHMQTQSSPMAPNDGVKLIFVTVIGAILVMTDLLVAGISRPAWAIAPPATLFLVPALGLGTDTGIVSFLYLAIGYLGILVAEGLNTTARWTRGLSRDSADGFGTATPVVWRAAGYVGVPAVVLTLILGVALPTLVLPGFGFGNGPGGNGPLQLTDPTLDLRRNLTQPQDRVVIQYQTDQPGGLYLRMASLPQLSSAGWGSVQIQLNTGTQLSQIPGLSSEPTKRRTTHIEVLGFGSQYLPLPYAPRSITAPGDWRYDSNSLMVVNADNRPEELRNISYTVQSVDVSPTSDQLETALAGDPADGSVTRDLPKDLPASLIKLTDQVIAGARTPAEKAAAIQAYLRSDRFTYSTDPLPGSGYQALENFLLKDHRGYCEQFAGAMAMMARVAGIPSRVSVGFLPGDKNGDTWNVSIREMHAWPELYFSGFGWVRFEPTPGSVTGAAPGWTVQDGNKSDNGPSDSQSTGPSASASAPTDTPTLKPNQDQAPTAAAPGFAWGTTLLGSGIGLLVLLILAAPATIRVRRRTSRLSGDGPSDEQVERAWQEIRDTVLDHGGRWPDGSPRAIGQEVGRRLDGEDSASMSQVATLVERSRYSRSFDDPTAAAALPALTHDIRRGLAAPLGWRRRLVATLVPRSLFRRQKP